METQNKKKHNKSNKYAQTTNTKTYGNLIENCRACAQPAPQSDSQIPHTKIEAKGHKMEPPESPLPDKQKTPHIFTPATIQYSPPRRKEEAGGRDEALGINTNRDCGDSNEALVNNPIFVSSQTRLPVDTISSLCCGSWSPGTDAFWTSAPGQMVSIFSLEMSPSQ